MHSNTPDNRPQQDVSQKNSALIPQTAAFFSQHELPATITRVTWLDRIFVNKMLNVLGNPPLQIKLWDGQIASSACKNPLAVVSFYDRGALLKIIMDHELHWGELYCSGRVKFEGNMTSLIEAIAHAVQARGKMSFLRKAIQWFSQRRNSNSPDKARQNIHHHYDIGNEFYKLWLDREEMQYTCAYFPRENMTLEQAQQAKLYHICHKLQLKPGDTVVEAGCGWGGLAHFMVKHYGATVTAYNISQEQVKFARQRAAEEGLNDQLEFVLDDYRNIHGQYDVFVSVGMLEHVAVQDYQELGQIIKKCLKPEGIGLIHNIGRIVKQPMNPWIDKYIFPGAYPPTLSEMMQVFEPNELAVADIENLRLHYSKTLQIWIQRFEQNLPLISKMMDEKFIRAWGLYLQGSRAAFNLGKLQLFQVVFNHMQNNAIPRSRLHIYQQELGEKTPAEKFH